MELFEHIRRDRREGGASIRGLARRHRVYRRAYVGRVRRELESGRVTVTIPQLHPPGEEAEADFGGVSVWLDGVLTELSMSSCGSPTRGGRSTSSMRDGLSARPTWRPLWRGGAA